MLSNESVEDWKNLLRRDVNLLLLSHLTFLKPFSSLILRMLVAKPYIHMIC